MMPQMPAVSFDHLIRAGEERGRDREAESVGGLEVHEQFENSRLLDGQLSGVRALQYFINIGSGPVAKAVNIGFVRYETAHLYERAMLVHCGQVIFGSELHDPLATCVELGIRYDDQPVEALGARFCEPCCKIRNSLGHNGSYIHPQAFCRQTQIVPISRPCKIITIPKRSYAFDVRKSFFEYLKSLLIQFRRIQRHSGQVAARRTKAWHKAAADRITSRCEYNRNRRGRPHGWGRSRNTDHYDDFRRVRDNFGCGGLGPLTSFAHDIIVRREVPTFDVPQIAQPFLERLDQMLCSSGREIRDVSSRLRLALESRGKHRRPADESNHLPPSHSITSSARARSVGGIVRPSALALLTLRTRLNRVGCSIGISPGLAPRRMAST